MSDTLYVDIIAEGASVTIDASDAPVVASVAVTQALAESSVNVEAVAAEYSVLVQGGAAGASGDYFGVATSSFTLTRDGNGDVASIAYANGITLTITRNGSGQVTLITSSDGKTKTILRDGNGVVTGATYA